jgi:hypothetical protein
MDGHLRDLEPRASAHAFDATSLLTIYIALLIALPSKLVVAPLGGAGTPAQLVGVAAALWYGWWRLARSTRTDTGSQPVRAAMMIFAGAVLCSYIAAMVRPINATELSTADLGLVSLVAWSGVVFVANDGIITIDRLYALLRRMSAAGGLIATVGIIQFVTGNPLTQYISIPGLSINQTLSGLGARDGFLRPSGTAVHPIEFGVVLTTILPIALVCAIYMKDRSLVRRWYPTVTIAMAIPLTISRSAIVGSIVCMVLLVPAFEKHTRLWVLGALGFLLLILFVALPGFLGTITGLFTNIGNDTSAQSRTGSYGIAAEFIERSPLFGRGFSTFLPSYWILDNQYLGLAIEVGFVGLAAFCWLMACAFRSAVRSRRASTDVTARVVGQALAASVACLTICTALYDLLSFPMSAGLLFLVVGVCGAFWRLVRQDDPTTRDDLIARVTETGT